MSRLTHASLVHRLFMPILPAVVITTAVGLNGLGARRPRLALGLAALFAIYNSAISWYITTLPYLPPKAVAEYIYL